LLYKTTQDNAGAVTIYSLSLGEHCRLDPMLMDIPRRLVEQHAQATSTLLCKMLAGAVVVMTTFWQRMVDQVSVV
jgi:hypothetical protein